METYELNDKDKMLIEIADEQNWKIEFIRVRMHEYI